MKLAPILALLTTFLFLSFPASSAEGSGAILRCDPAVIVEKIDGGGKYTMASVGGVFIECEIPLTAGAHSLDICFDASWQSFNGGMMVKCDKARTVKMEAVAGHTYRVKLNVTRDSWTPWIEDVTEAEAGLWEKPVKKPRPKGSKKDLETVLVMRATPAHAWMQFYKGRAWGKWFEHGTFGELRSKGQSTKGVPDGFHIMRVKAGDTVAMTGGRMMVGSIFVAKSIQPCGNYPVRVYEDIPAGKVLYLGNYTITEGPGGYTDQYVDDLEEARAYLATHEPELAPRLENTTYRVLGTTNFCYGFPGEIPGPPPVIPADASANR